MLIIDAAKGPIKPLDNNYMASIETNNETKSKESKDSKHIGPSSAVEFDSGESQVARTSSYATNSGTNMSSKDTLPKDPNAKSESSNNIEVGCDI